ncbi:MAG: DNA mismatch repair protein MutL [Bacteroidia bacterium]|jgi:DNA mismatch repair protein MutL
MPDFIRLLPDAIANQIAAGEVVQRPASVVKELLENSLDAGATSLTLLFKDGGQTLIQVIDNGKGMSDTDARMCWERHATSKIKAATDLFNLTTFGFRGEALASIASVAHVEMKSKDASSTLGTHLIIEASSVKKQEAIACPQGTSISVKNLFFNIPARRNFLKSITVETKYIIEEFQRIAISRPDVEMILFNGKNEVFSLGQATLKERITTLMLKGMKGQLIEILEETGIVDVQGFIGSPDLAKRTRGNQLFYVNGRYIKEPYFHHAIANAFEGLIEKEFHPFYVLFLSIQPEKIDVNVHPTKTEVKFEDSRHMYMILKSVAKKALASFHTTPTIENELITSRLGVHFGSSESYVSTPSIKTNTSFNPFQTNKPKKQTAWEKLYEPFRDEISTSNGNQQQEAEINLEGAELNFQKLDDASLVISDPFQISNAYIVAKLNHKLILVHQQRAHERVLYEKYLNELENQKAATQQLLFPRTIELYASDYALIMSMLEEITCLGFDISPFGKNAIIINGTPADIQKIEARDMLEGVLSNFKQNEQELTLTKRENLAQSMSRSMCTRSGVALSKTECEQLLLNLFNCKQPSFTPNGRPTIITFAEADLAGMFK